MLVLRTRAEDEIYPGFCKPTRQFILRPLQPFSLSRSHLHSRTYLLLFLARIHTRWLETLFVYDDMTAATSGLRRLFVHPPSRI